MTIIIGAGPAGLGAALGCKSPALILERNSFAGKKLLLSGSGQCNVTNAATREAFLARMGEFKNFLKPAFYQFSNRDLMRLLEDAGCPLFTREDGKVFPQSLRSTDVRDTLLKLVINKGHHVQYHSRIVKVEKADHGFTLYDSNGIEYSTAKLILAAGGAAYPQTGSDGSGYDLAKQLGHSILDPKPALAAVKIRNFSSFRECAGITLPRTSLKLGKQMMQGDLLITHLGFSGPLILDNSYRMQPSARIGLVFDAAGRFVDLVKQHPRKQLSSILQLLDIPHRLSEAILQHCGVPNCPAAELCAKDRNLLAGWLKHAEFEIQSLSGFDLAMSDYGGVDIHEVKASSMESKLIPGLYLAGESLAYSLPSGGFSLQMAMATGYLAGIKSE